MTQRIYIIIPAARRAKANAALDAAGYGPDSFRVELAPAGTGPRVAPEPTAYVAAWCLPMEAGDALLALVGSPRWVQRVDIDLPETGAAVDALLVSRGVEPARRAGREVVGGSLPGTTHR